MLPADQRLRADELTRAEVDLRLVVEPQLPALERALQLLLDRHRLDRALAHLGVEELGARAAAGLGPVHRGVGVLHQTLVADLVAGLGQRHADRRGQAQLRPAGPDRLGDRALQAVGHADRLEHPADGLAQDRELVAAEAGDRVLRAQRGAQPGRDLAQHLVAGGVTEAVVDALEAIEVDEVDGGDGRAVAARERLAQAVAEQRAVREAGERVVQREPLELGLHPLAVADVEKDAVEERRLRVLTCSAHHGHLVPDPAPGAVRVAQAVLLHERLARVGAVGLVRVTRE